MANGIGRQADKQTGVRLVRARREHGWREGREARLAERDETCGSSTTRCDPRRGQDRKRKGLRCSGTVAMGNSRRAEALSGVSRLCWLENGPRVGMRRGAC
jgi:hypothetical protein